jgi:hypothetical protein
MVPFLVAIPLWVKILRHKEYKTPLFFCAWVACCLLYWFVTAPALRFGAVFFQIFFSLALAFAFHQKGWLSSWRGYGAKFLQNRRLCFIVSALVLLVAVSVSFRSLYSLRNLSPKRERNVFHIGSVPSRSLSSRVLDASVSPPIILFVPDKGDQCGNSPLPCTPYDNPRLKLRVPGDLGGGFYVE